MSRQKRPLWRELIVDLKNWGTFAGLGVGGYLSFWVNSDSLTKSALTVVAGFLLATMCAVSGGLIIAGPRRAPSKKKEEGDV